MSGKRKKRSSIEEDPEIEEEEEEQRDREEEGEEDDRGDREVSEAPAAAVGKKKKKSVRWKKENTGNGPGDPPGPEDEEARSLVRMSSRRDENYQRKENLFEDLPSDNLYGMKLRTEPTSKSRREASVSDLVVVADNPLEREEGGAEGDSKVMSSAWFSALNKPGPVAGPKPLSAEAAKRVEQETGARRLVVPRLARIQPLHKFVNDNVGALLQAQKRQAEEAREAAAANPPAASKERSTLSIGKRSSTLQASSPAASSSEPKKPPASVSLPPLPLPADDPAAHTLDRIDLQTAMLVPFLESAYQYHKLKNQITSDKLALMQPYEMSPEHVAWSHNKFFPPFQPCMFKMRCEGLNSQNEHKDLFPFIQYVPPKVRAHFEQTGRLPVPKSTDQPGDSMELDEKGDPLPGMCLRCLTKTLQYLVFANIAEDQRSNKIFVEFKHPVGVPGGYDPSAVLSFSDGRTNGMTQSIRCFAPEQFYPCERWVISQRRGVDGRTAIVRTLVPSYEEHDTVKYFDASRTKQRRALEADVRATAPSSVPPKPPGAEVVAVRPAIYPVTTVVNGPTSAVSVLRGPILGDSRDPKLDTSVPRVVAQEPEVPRLGAYEDWTKSLLVAEGLNQAFAKHAQASASALAEQQQKNGYARRRLSEHRDERELRSEGGDAHIIRNGVLRVPLKEGLALDQVKPCADAAKARIDLTLRDLDDAFRLMVHWLESGQVAGPEALGLVSIEGQLFNLAQTPFRYENALQHLVCARINTCLELEELLFGGVGARRPWLFARSLPLPGATAAAAASSKSGGGASRRKKASAPAMNITSNMHASLLPVSLVAELSAMSPAAREQLGVQVVYWRDRHARVVETLWRATRGGIQPAEDPPELVPPEYMRALRADPLARGLERPPFGLLFDDPAKPLPPLFDKDVDTLRTVTELRCHETPASYLREHFRPTASLERKDHLLETVLVDFRATVDYLADCGPDEVVGLSTQWWMPSATEDTDPGFIDSAAFAVDRGAWVEKTCEHIRRKDASNDGRLRAEKLRQDNLDRTAAVASAFAASSDRAPPKEWWQDKDELFKRVLLEKGWRGEALGVNSRTNYLILVAVVYRVNYAMYEMERERELLEQHEKELASRFPEQNNGASSSSPMGQEEEDEDDAEEEDQPARAFPRVRTSEEDDAEILVTFAKRLRRITSRMKRDADAREPSSATEAMIRRDIEHCLSRLHRWKRFAFSHLPLAQVIVDAPRCDDAFLLEESLPNHRLSLYTVHYPFSENGWGEEMLQNTRHRTRLVDVVHGIGGGGSTGTLPSRPTVAAPANTTTKKTSKKDDVTGAHDYDEEIGGVAQDASSDNPWVGLIKKIFPKACSDRGFPEKCDEICRANVRCFHYVLESLLATLAGLYRHCRNPVRFSLALSLYRVKELSRDSPVHRDVMLDVFFGNEELVINALRENISWQFADDPNLWMIDSSWVRGCTHFVRSLFQRQGNLRGINAALIRLYGSHGFLSGTQSLPASMAMSTGDGSSSSQSAAAAIASSAAPSLSVSLGKPSVYRVTNKNWVKYMWGLFRQIGTEAVLGSVIVSVSSGKQEPRVYKLSDNAFDLVLHVVESTRPGEPIRTEWFRLIGVSDHGVRLLLSAYELFRRRAHENDIKDVVRTLKPVDFELLSLFFHLLRCHSDQRLIPLDATTARDQELSMRHRACIPPSVEHIPRHLMQAVSCSIVGCNEFKNYVVQRTRNPLFSGFMHLPYDADNNRLICASKKTILVHSRNEDRKRAGNGKEPAYLAELKKGDVSSFYGSYECISKLVRLPPGTNGVDDAAALEEALFIGEEENAPEGAAKKNKRKDGGRRENLVKSFVPEIAEKLRLYSAALAKHGVPVTQHSLYSLDYVPKEIFDKLNSKQIEEIERARAELDAECKKEERRIFKLKTLRPCFEMPVTEAPIRGYIFEKDSNKSRNASVAATICPSCACVFDFSLRLNYANGITCGYCDRTERRLLYAPRCFVCRKTGLERMTVGQGPMTVRYETVHLSPAVFLDDTTDWMPRVVRVCKHCWCEWMRNEARFMTLADVLRQLYYPSASSAPQIGRGNGYTVSIRRDRWLRRDTVFDQYIGKEDQWPSKQFVEMLSAVAGEHLTRAGHDQLAQERRIAVPRGMADTNRPVMLVTPPRANKSEKRLRQKMSELNRKRRQAEKGSGNGGAGTLTARAYGTFEFTITRTVNPGY